MSDNFVDAIESPVEVEWGWIGDGAAVEMQLLSLGHGDVPGDGVFDGEVGNRGEEDTDLPLVLQGLLRNISVDGAAADEQVVMLRAWIKCSHSGEDLAVRTLCPPNNRKLS